MAEASAKKRVVEAAIDIIDSEGLEALSIRRLSRKLNCVPGNIYYYYKNLDEVIAYAVFSYYADYLAEMATFHAREGFSLESYQRSWELYVEHAFRRPEIFLKLIYGPYARMLGDLEEVYYAMFPERKKQLTSEEADQLMENAFDNTEDHLVLGYCVRQGSITAEAAETLGFILRTSCQGVLYELIDCRDDTAAREKLKQQFLDMLKEVFARFAE